MDARLKQLTPLRYLCPHCQEWHSWPGDDELGSANASNKFRLKCHYNSSVDYSKFWYNDDKPVIIVTPWCLYVQNINAQKVTISDTITEENTVKLILDVATPEFTFLHKEIPCKTCENRRNCRVQLGKLESTNQWYDTFGLEFDREEYEQIMKEGQNTDQQVKKKGTTTKREETKMKESLTMSTVPAMPFDINAIAKDLGISFGVNTDQRIQSTIMGTVVEYEPGRFRGFNRENSEITEYANLATVKLPIVVVPATTVQVGDTILQNEEPFFITKNQPGDVWGANPITSKEEKLIPISNPIGIKCYTRLISIGELMGFKGENPQNTRIILWLLTMVTSKLCMNGIDSANEKIKEITDKGAKYMELLVPFACVAFAAYAMKGKDMRLDNIADSAKKAFNLDLDCLKDKKNLQRIAAIGVATTAVITMAKNGLNKAATFEGNEGQDDCQEIEGLFTKICKAIEPFENTIRKVLPTALAVCAVKVFNGDFDLSGIYDKLQGIILIAQDTICDKFGIKEDFFNKDNLKKVAILMGVAVVAFVAYKKQDNNAGKEMQQTNDMLGKIVPMIAPLIPAIILLAPQMKEFFAKFKPGEEEDLARLEENL